MPELDLKNIAKAVVRAGIKSGAAYVRHKRAHQAEQDAKRKEMLKWYMDKAKTTMNADIATANILTQRINAQTKQRDLDIQEGKLKSKDDQTNALMSEIDGLPHLSPEDKQIAKILIKAGKDPSDVLTGTEDEQSVHDKFFASLDEVYPGDDEAMVQRRQQAKEQYIEKLTNIPAKDESEIQGRIDMVREIYKDDPEKLQQAMDKILLGSAKKPDGLSDIEQAREDLRNIDKWEADGEIDKETADLFREGVRHDLIGKDTDGEGDGSDIEGDGSDIDTATGYQKSIEEFAKRGMYHPEIYRKYLKPTMDDVRDRAYGLKKSANMIIAVEAAAKESPENPVAQLALLYAFIKAIDEGSVVRESEINLFRAARSWVTQIEMIYNRAAKGEVLSGPEIESIVRVVNELGEAQRKDTENLKNFYAGDLKALGYYKIEGLDNTDPDKFLADIEAPQISVDLSKSPEQITDDARKQIDGTQHKSFDMAGFVNEAKEAGFSKEAAAAVVRKRGRDIDEFNTEWDRNDE